MFWCLKNVFLIFTSMITKNRKVLTKEAKEDFKRIIIVVCLFCAVVIVLSLCLVRYFKRQTDGQNIKVPKMISGIVV